MAAAGVCNTALRRLSPVNDPASVHRHRFPILDTCSYLVSHSLGAMPVEARAGLERYAEQWASRGVLAWEEGWWEAPLRVGDRLRRWWGPLPGRSPWCPRTSPSPRRWVASCPRPAGTESRVVIADLDFPHRGVRVALGARGRGADGAQLGRDQPPHRDRAPGDRRPSGGWCCSATSSSAAASCSTSPRSHAPPTTPAPWWCSTATSRRGRSPSPSPSSGWMPPSAGR